MAYVYDNGALTWIDDWGNDMGDGNLTVFGPAQGVTSPNQPRPTVSFVEGNGGSTWWENALNLYGQIELTKRQIELQREGYFAPPYQPVTLPRNPSVTTGDPKNLGLIGGISESTGIAPGLLLAAGLVVAALFLLRK